MILKEQAAIITTLLNDIAEDENFDIQFLYNRYTSRISK